MKKQRFHPVYVFRLLKKGWLALLPPLFSALIRFDLEGLRAALIGEAVTFLLLLTVSALIWWMSHWHWEDGRLIIHKWLLVSRTLTLDSREIACIRITRNLFQRMTGASHVSLYFTHRGGVQELYLTKKAALQLMDAILPSPGSQAKEYHPTGVERLGLSAVSGNLVVSLGILCVAYTEVSEIIDRFTTYSHQELTDAAAGQFNRVLSWAELWLPAGLALAAVISAVAGTLYLSIGLLRMSNFRASSGDGIFQSRSGILERVEFRARLDRVAQVDLHRSPLARITGCFPVYLKVGSYGRDMMPCFLYRTGRERDLEALLPGVIVDSPRAVQPVKGRSLPAFLVPPGILTGAGLLLFLVSRWALPEISWLFLPLTVWGLLWLLIQLEGFFRERITFGSDCLIVVNTVGMTHHWRWLFFPETGCSLSQSPLTLPTGRCTAVLHIPGDSVKVRSVLRKELEENWKLRMMRRTNDV